jgi:hypothetical protein
MNNATILQKKAGQVIPKEMIELALKNCPTVSGFAVRDGDGISYEFSDKATSADSIMKLQDAVKDHPLFLYFGNFTNGFDIKKDIQPFCLKAGEDVVVAYFIEGDFNKFSDPKSERTDEANLSSTLVDLMLAEMFENVEGDTGKFTAKLHSPLFKAQLMATIGHRGLFAFLPPVGDPIVFGQNELGGEFEWGNTSQLWGFGKVAEKKAPIIEQTVEKAKKKFSSFLGGVTEKAPGTTPAPAVAPAVEPAKPPIEAPKTDTAIAAASNVGRTIIFPPPKLTGSARNKWFRLMNDGELPGNHQSQKTGVQVTMEVAEIAKRSIPSALSVRLETWKAR